MSIVFVDVDVNRLCWYFSFRCMLWCVKVISRLMLNLVVVVCSGSYVVCMLLGYV